MVEEICLEKETVFNATRLSHTTTWKVEDICSDLLNQLRNKAKEFESFYLALYERNDTNDTAQSLIAIRDTTKSFEVVE
jgi:hypothetical protein